MVTPIPKAPRWMMVASAVIAVVAATGIPGLVTGLTEMDHDNAAAEAFVAELPLVVMMIAFGVLVARRAWWAAILVLATNVAIDFMLGIGLLWNDVAHKTGPLELVFGVGGGAIAAVSQTVLALCVWVLLAWLARDAKPRSYAIAIAAISIVHVVTKSVWGGSVIYAAIGATYVVWLARGSMARFGAVPIALVALGLQVRSCMTMTHEIDVHTAPMCDLGDTDRPADSRDVLATKARKAATLIDVGTAISGSEAVVYVMPSDEATKSKVERAIQGTRCVIDSEAGWSKPSRISVEGTTNVTVDVTAALVEIASTPELREKIERAARDQFRGAGSHIHVPRHDPFAFTPDVPGVAISWSFDDKAISDYLAALPAGSVLVLGHVKVIDARVDAQVDAQAHLP